MGNERGDFELEGISSIKRIVALRKPSASVRPPTGKGMLWRLISHLSLNYLSIVEEGKESLQEVSASTHSANPATTKGKSPD